MERLAGLLETTPGELREWVKSVGSIPDLERPEQPPLRDIPPLDDEEIEP
jgi:hypothetical protein